MVVEQIVQGLAASSIAIYGATDREGHPGARPLAHLRRANYTGAVLPINPAKKQILGYQAFPSLAAAAKRPDLALIAVPAAHVEWALKDCVEAGVKLVSIVTGGFGEIGQAGQTRQQALLDIIQGSGTRVFGPNCLGLMAPASGVFATGTAVVEATWPSAGRVAIASQSGAVGCSILAELYNVGLGIRSWVSTGNEMDLTVADVVAVAAEDGDVDTVLVYLESVRDAEAMRNACQRAAAAGKRVFVLKAGRSELGGKAVASHTGALATSDRFYNLLFEDAGAKRVGTIRELVDAARIAPLFKARTTGGGVAVFTLSGGLGALAADAMEDAEVPAASVRPATQTRMLELAPGCAPGNPIDATGRASSDVELMRSLLELVMVEPDVAAIVLILGHLGFTPSYTRRVIPMLSELTGRHDVPVFAVTRVPDAAKGALTGTSIPVFAEVVDAVRAIALAGNFERSDERPQQPAFLGGPKRGPVLPDYEGLAVLREAGVPTVPTWVLTDRADLELVATSTGLPMALKAMVPGVSHKTDIGAVRLHLEDLDAAERAFDDLARLFESGNPTLIAQPMLGQAALELIVGAIVDPVFGPHVLVGSGGIWAELLGDTQMAVAPINEERAREMLSGLRIAPIFAGHRGGRSLPMDEIVKVLVAVSELACAKRNQLQEIEINPLLVAADGSVVAVDALIVEVDGADG